MKTIPPKDISTQFIVYLTIFLSIAALWIFAPFLEYILVAAVLALATSHGFSGALGVVDRSNFPEWVKKRRRILVTSLFTCLFLLMIFLPLLYFFSVTFDQVSSLNIEEIKSMIFGMWNKLISLTKEVGFLQDLIQRLKAESSSLVNSNSIESVLGWAENMVSGVGSLIVQVVWILTFYFLFNLYGATILHFIATLMPTSPKHERYLYKECTGTVAVVFYGALFNMLAQGLAFGLLMFFIGDYNSLYLGVLAGFCSIIPIIGAALVYIPVVAIELFNGHYLNAIIILIFVWAFMGFFIDNILRLFFIGSLKKLFGFEYTMNEILILLSILAGISTFGFWGLIIGPSVVALTLAAANICRDNLGEDEHTPRTGC